MKNLITIAIVLCLSIPCFGFVWADLDSSGRVDFYDLAILCEQWLKTPEDQNALTPKLEFSADSEQISFIRNSIAYDNDFREYPENSRRIEPVCIASRPAVIINRKVNRIVYAVDGNQVLCGWGSSLYSTSDGESFTRIIDIQSNTILDAGGTFANHTVPDEAVQALMIMADGSWLLSTGRGLPYIRGHLFRSANKGASWSICKWAADGTDFQLGMAFVPEWASIGIAGNEVVAGEYGYRSQYDNPRRIYYSDDFGATWTMIIDIGPAGWQPEWGYIKGQHCHAVTFSAADTSDI